jgi:hypothetical protein
MTILHKKFLKIKHEFRGTDPETSEEEDTEDEEYPEDGEDQQEMEGHNKMDKVKLIDLPKGMMIKEDMATEGTDRSQLRISQ